MKRFKLTTAEEQQLSALRRKGVPPARGFIVVTHFCDGPRGGRYRPERTPVLRTEEEALAKAEYQEERAEYNVPVRDTAIFEVNRFGEVVG